MLLLFLGGLSYPETIQSLLCIEYKYKEDISYPFFVESVFNTDHIGSASERAPLTQAKQNAFSIERISSNRSVNQVKVLKTILRVPDRTHKFYLLVLTLFRFSGFEVDSSNLIEAKLHIFELLARQMRNIESDINESEKV